MKNVVRCLKQIARPIGKRFPAIAMAYYSIKTNRSPGEPRKTPMGFRLVGNPAMESGVFEVEETQIFRKILSQMDVFIDVGANIGYYCCIALQEGKYVVAFEPIERNLRYLYKNIRANGWEDKIEIFPIALSHRIGILEMFGTGTGASLIKGWAGIPEYWVQVVPTSTLDNVLGSRFLGKSCLVLMDVEGSEKLVLEGAFSFLGRDPKPIWMVEISITEHQPKGVAVNPYLLSTFQIFWKMGYEARTANTPQRLIRPADIESIIRSGNNSLGTHNFIFIEQGRWREIIGA